MTFKSYHRVTGACFYSVCLSRTSTFNSMCHTPSRPLGLTEADSSLLFCSPGYSTNIYYISNKNIQYCNFLSDEAHFTQTYALF